MLAHDGESVRLTKRSQDHLQQQRDSEADQRRNEEMAAAEKKIDSVKSFKRDFLIAIIGAAVGIDNIEKRWYEPLNDTIKSVVAAFGTCKISNICERIIAQKNRLNK